MKKDEVEDEYTDYLENDQDSKIAQIIKAVDILGKKVKLYFGGNSNRHKTLYGGILSLILYAVFLAMFYIFGNDMFFKTKPIVTESVFYDVEPKRYNLTEDSFLFWVGLQDGSSNYFYDPTIFRVEAKFLIKSMVNNSVKWTTKILKTRKCDLETDIDKKFNGLMKKDPLNTAICLDSTDILNKQLYLQGTFTNDDFTSIYINLFSCTNNTTPGVICKTQNQINEKLSGGYLVMDYIENFIDPLNYTNPNTRINLNSYTTSSNNYKKDWIFYFRNVEYLTDDNPLLEGFSTQINFLQTNIAKESISYSIADNKFASFGFRLAQERYIITRRYMKIQDVFAQMSGIIYLIFYLFQFIIYIFASIDFNMTLINFSYSFGIKTSDEGSKISYKLESTTKIENLKPDMIELYSGEKTVRVESESQNNDKKDNTTDTNTKENQNEKFYKDIELEKKKIKFSFCQMLSIALCEKKKVFKRYYWGLQKINNVLDIRKLIRQSNELILLKRLLLNPDQQRVFNVISSTNCYSEIYDTDLENVENQDWGNLIDDKNFILSRNSFESLDKLLSKDDILSTNLQKLARRNLKFLLEQ